jgi:hypothetical protein
VPQLPELIRAASSDPRNFPYDMPERLAKWLRELSEHAMDGFQSVAMEAVYEKSRYQFTDPEKAALLAKYAPLIKASALDALAVFDKYVPDVLHKIKHRLRFEPKREPDNYPLPQAGHMINVPDVASFFGVEHHRVSNALVLDWRDYCDRWAAIPARLKDLPAAKFWSHPEVRAWQRSDQLCILGRWYAEIPISNVATERVFAIMRSSESPLRRAMAESSMDEELGAKVNSWIVDAMLARQVGLFR